MNLTNLPPWRIFKYSESSDIYDAFLKNTKKESYDISTTENRYELWRALDIFTKTHNINKNKHENVSIKKKRCVTKKTLFNKQNEHLCLNSNHRYLLMHKEFSTKQLAKIFNATENEIKTQQTKVIQESLNKTSLSLSKKEIDILKNKSLTYDQKKKLLKITRRQLYEYYAKLNINKINGKKVFTEKQIILLGNEEVTKKEKAKRLKIAIGTLNKYYNKYFSI